MLVLQIAAFGAPRQSGKFTTPGGSEKYEIGSAPERHFKKEDGLSQSTTVCVHGALQYVIRSLQIKMPALQAILMGDDFPCERGRIRRVIDRGRRRSRFRQYASLMRRGASTTREPKPARHDSAEVGRRPTLQQRQKNLWGQTECRRQDVSTSGYRHLHTARRRQEDSCVALPRHGQSDALATTTIGKSAHEGTP
jgi:hypothetical protein